MTFFEFIRKCLVEDAKRVKMSKRLKQALKDELKKRGATQNNT